MKLIAILLNVLLFISTANAKDTGKIETVVLAGGCFWCIEADYEKLDGVVEVISGYAGGHLDEPTYRQVSAGNSGHIEVVKVMYKPDVISFRQIIDYFWLHVDPTRDDGQFCDYGLQYRPAIFYKNDKELAVIKQSQKYINKNKPFPQPLKVELIALTKFYDAEDYHQDYYKKNPIRYNFYRYNCGRDSKIKQLWGH